MVRPFLLETPLSFRLYMHCQKRDPAGYPANETHGETLHYRIHVRPNPLAGQYPPLGQIPFPRFPGTDRLRKDSPKNRFCRTLLRCRNCKTRILQNHHTGNCPASQRTARIRDYRPLHRYDGKDHTPQSVGLVVDP